jgi:hypothetical protein
MNCLVKDCPNKYKARGYCSTHHKQILKFGYIKYLHFHAHGMTNSLEYKTWNQIKNRCLNANHHAYSNYGGRGITVCERWKNSFENFLADMGRKPSKEYSIDRINANGNYETGNCRWATIHQQASNRRNSLPVPGVSWDKSKNTWKAILTVNRKVVLNKRFKNYNDAVQARKIAEEQWIIDPISTN